jgi:hypothetical protein
MPEGMREYAVVISSAYQVSIVSCQMIPNHGGSDVLQKCPTCFFVSSYQREG